MKIKRIKKLQVNSFEFAIVWDRKLVSSAGSLCYQPSPEIRIGVKNENEVSIYSALCHELLELCAIEMNVRFQRPDIQDDYLFSFDHRQFETLSNMFGGLLAKFIE